MSTISNSVGFHSLPPEMIPPIFDTLSVRELASARQLSRTCHEAIPLILIVNKVLSQVVSKMLCQNGLYPPKLDALYQVGIDREYTQKIIGMLFKRASFDQQEVLLEQIPFLKKRREIMDDLPADLEHLYCSRLNRTPGVVGHENDADLSQLGRLTALKDLRIYQAFTTSEALLSLSLHTNLTSLHLHDVQQFVDQKMSLLSSLTRLENLVLLNCGGGELTGRGLSHLTSLNCLTYLQIIGYVQPDLGFRLPDCIGTFTTLKRLDFSKVGIRDADCQKLKSLTQLTSLNLSGNNEVTVVGLCALTSLKNLTHLTLTNCFGFTDQDIADAFPNGDKICIDRYPTNPHL